MQTWQFIALIASVLLSGGGVLLAVLLTNKKNGGIGEMLITYKNENMAELDRTRRDISEDMEQQIRYLNDNMRNMQTGQEEKLSAKQEAFFNLMTEKQTAMNERIDSGAKGSEERFRTFESKNTSDLNDIRETMERRLSSIQSENDKHLDDVRDTMKKSLDEVRGVVDEKLQETLDKRITESFRMVNERLAEVYQGLGEMKTLATSKRC